MEPLKWGPVYELGIPYIDAQHRELLRLVNEAVAGMEGRNQQLLEAVLDRLAEYARVHFSEEEALMVAADYPRLEGHIREHGAFHERVANLYSRFLEGDAQVAPELCTFLQAWLIAHIQGSDRHYVPYLLAGSDSNHP